MESQMLLRDAEIFPSDKVLKDTLGNVYDVLDISEAIKTELASAKAIGRLIPMIFNINNANQLEELLTVVRFKKTLK